MAFTKNEKFVIKSLLDNGRMSDAEIARKLKITLEAVRKIRQKLEKQGVIQGYSAGINYEKIGITAFAVALLNVTPEAWEKFSGRTIQDKLFHPNVIKFYRIPRGNISHIIVYGFRNMNELDNFFQIMQEKQSKYIKIIKIYSFSNENFGKKSAGELIRTIVEDETGEKKPKPNLF